MMLAPRSRLADFWERVKSSYWFVPSMMFFGAILLALLMVELDLYLGRSEGLTDSPWFPKFEGEAARSILSTIASGMVTITALVFSLTIVSLQLASSQFGPRLLRAFMSSLGNQIVLGTFTSTFIYCLIVVGTVRDSIGFIPQLATAFGILLGIISIGILIYFIHHVASSIRIETLIGRLCQDLREVIDEMYPSKIGEQRQHRRDDDSDRFSLDSSYEEVRADTAGYIRRIDSDMLMAAACEHDLIVRVISNPGDFVVEGGVLFHVGPKARVSGGAAELIRESTVLGHDRTPSQDVGFAIRLLVEVALRALSPGINDPFTAVECINRLGEALCVVVRRPTPSAHRLDASSQLRVIAKPMSLEAMAHLAFDPIARAGGANGDVATRLLETILTIASCAAEPEDRQFMVSFGCDLEQQLRGQLQLERDRRAVAERFSAALDRITGRSSGHPAESSAAT
jgi:uncharacterized membrane protein